MLKRRLISISVLSIIFPLSFSFSALISDDRMVRLAMLANIFVFLTIIVLSAHRKYPHLLGFDDSNPLPRIDIGMAVLLTGVAAYNAAAAPLIFGPHRAEAAILGIIALAAVLGWLLRDKGPAASRDTSTSETQSARADDIPRIRIDLAGAFIGLAALNATFFSVMIREPGLFVLAMLGNITLVTWVCWLARDKGDTGAGGARSENGS